MTLQQARRIGAPRAIALGQCCNGVLEFQAGRWPEAEAALLESIELYRQIGAAAGEALGYQRLGVLQMARGQLDEALVTLEDGVITAKRALLRAHLLGRLHAAIARNRLLAGDLAAADHALSLGLSVTQEHGSCSICESLLLPVGVSLRIAQGNLAAAGLFYQQLAAAAAGYGSRTWMATASRARAELAAARGEEDTARACFQEAYEGFKAARNEYEAANCLELIARLQG